MLVTIRDISPTAKNINCDIQKDFEKAYKLLTDNVITEYYYVDKDGKLIKL